MKNNNVLRVMVKSTTIGWTGRVDDIDGAYTFVEWTRDQNGLPTTIGSWVLSNTLEKI